MKIPALRICLALLVTLPAQADTPLPLQPGDFASGRQLQVTGRDPFYRLNLPAEIYSGTAWPDLRDVRVFNSAGEALPHTLLRPAASASPIKRITLQGFRVNDAASTAGSDGTPKIELLAPGVSLRVEPAASNKSAAAEYLLTSSADENTYPPDIQTLHLDWEPAAGNWQLLAQVDGSMNLRSWVPVLQSQPVMDLQNGAQRFEQKDIAFNTPQNYRYWRLRFSGGTAPALRSITASLASEHTPAPPVTITATLQSSGADGAVFTLPAPQLLNAVRVEPRLINSVLPMRIEYRADSKAPWQQWADTVAYRLASPQGERLSSSIKRSSDVLVSELRLVPTGPGWGAQTPELIAEREARILVFNARGSGPWLLAWGSRAAQEQSVDFQTLQTSYRADEVDAIAPAEPGVAQTLGGPERLTALAPAERQKRWQTMLVWAALIAGAAALGWLALRVWKETQQAK